MRITIFFLISAITLFSCNAKVRLSAKKNTVEAGCIPPEFGDTSQVLLVVVGRPDMYPVIAGGGFDYYEKKNFEENYKGHYVVVHVDSINVPKYADLDKFRYVFDNEYLKMVKKYYSPDLPTVTYDHLYVIRDRKTKQLYKAVYHNGSWYKVMKGLIINMNARLGHQ